MTIHLLHDQHAGTSLDRRVAGVAERMASFDLDLGRPLAVVSGSGLLLSLLAHAAARLGVPLMPIDPSLPDAVVAGLMDQAGSADLVGERALSGRRTIDPAALLQAGEGSPSLSRMADGDLALLVATSGSTGTPKAVMLTAGSLRAAAAASAALLPLGPEDAWLACLPLFHIGGYSILVRCALAGALAVVHDRFDPERVAVSLAHDRITHLSVVPTMLALLLEAAGDRPPPPSLRHVLVGGAALATPLGQRALAAGWPIRPSYGMSETASQLATLTDVPADWQQGRVGRPLPGAEVAIEPGGRLKVRGPMLMAGYANPQLRRGDGLADGWFVTNDAVEIGEDGGLTVIGRGDDVLISGGKKIHPLLVEDLVSGCPGVTAAAVGGRPDPLWGQVLVAVFAGPASPEAVLAWCRENVPGPLRPRQALQVEALPQTSNGKLDRRALRRLLDG